MLGRNQPQESILGMLLSLCAWSVAGIMVSAVASASTAARPGHLYGVAAGNGVHVVVGADGVILSSADALYWTNRFSTLTNTLRAATFGDGQFLVVGDSGRILTSSDGMGWTQRVSGTSRTLRAATYGYGQFVVVGDQGTVLRSLDGVTWTNSPANTTNQLTDITFGAGRFVAVGSAGTGFGTIYTSTNALAWSIAVNVINSYDLHSATYGGEKFVATGSGALVMTSTNGVNWQQSFSGLFGLFPRLTFGDGRFVRVAETPYSFVSTEGANWLNAYLGAPLVLHGVTFANGRFLAVGGDDNGNGIILISREGVTWSDALLPLFAPIITYQPASLELFPGNILGLYAEAVGNPPPTYQWRLNGADIPGATQASFELEDPVASDAGDYTLVARNEVGAVTSLVANVSFPIKAPEVISDLDPTYAAPVGNDVYLQPYVEGSPAPIFIWFFNGMLIPGETNAFLALTNVTASDAGEYFVVAANGAGVAASRTATLTVAPSLIYSGPDSQFVTNSSLQLSVGVQSTSPLTYQWFFNDTLLPGATNFFLSRIPVSTNDAGAYFVVVSNVYGAITSQVAVVGVDRMAPYLAQSPQSQTVLVESGVSFSVRAVGSPDLLMQWRKNGSILPGEVGSNLYLPPSFNDAGAYDVIVRNAFGSVTSAVAVLTVTSAPPRFVYGPVHTTIRANETAYLSAYAEAGPLPHYQWRRDGVALTGQTTDTLVLGNVSLADNGDYTVVASNSAGSVTSRVARLTVYLVPPYFVSHPRDEDTTVGSSRTLSAYAEGAPDPAYQWYFNGAPVPGANLNYLGLPDLSTNQAGLYTVVASNAAGVAVSRGATVMVRFEVPVFLLQPLSQTVLWGQSVNLFAAALGGPLPTYQWLLNGSPIPGATNQSLYFPFATPVQSGNYRVVASNTVGVATSAVAVVTITAQAPIFTTQPSGRTALAGDFVSFFGAAIGGPPPAYQWLYNGGPIAGATNTSLPLGLVTPAQAGNYHLVAFNSSGSVTSSVATLIVLQQAPVFTQQPVSQTILWGGSVNLSSSASGGPPPIYQWLFNEMPIVGATGSSLFLSSVTPSQAGNYRVVASNPVGVVTSQVAVVTVNSQAPVFTTQPISRTVLWGDFVNDLFASAVGGPPPALQWLFNGEPLPGQTNNYLNLGMATPEQAGNYSLVASNPVGVATSQVAVLVVNSQAPVFATEPSDQTVLWGEFVQFYSYAVAGPPPAYQWYFNGVPLPEKTNHFFNIEFAGTNHTGFYEVVATNLFGSVTSRLAALVVESAPPRFLDEPSDLSAPWGYFAAFYSAAEGGPPPEYQWRFNGEPISGATNNYLQLFNVTTNNAGAYDVVARNFLGAVTSRVALLEVEVEAPQFGDSFAGSEVVEGADVRLPAYAYGAPPPGLFLLFNDSPVALPFAEGGGFLLTEVTTNDAGRYAIVASNFVGSVTSEVAMLTVRPGGPLDRWMRRNPLPQGDNLLAVTHGPGRFVATGERGSVVRSTNGFDWVAQRIRADADLAGVAYGNGLFVSVSRAGNILTSTDAVQWLPRVLDAQLSLEGITFGDGRFVAVGTGQGNLSLASTNGVDWTRGTASLPTRFKGVAYGQGLFVGVLQGQGAWPAILVSSDGLDWTVADASIWENLENVAFANGQFVAVGSNGVILTSPDGWTWTRQTSGTTRRIIEVAYGNGRWVAVAVRGIILSSADGVSWRDETSGTPDRLEGVTFADGLFVALGENGTTLTSTNGVVWTKRNVGSTRDLDGIAIGANGQVVAVGKFGTILSTPDGVRITERASGTTNDLHGVGFANGLYVAVGDGGSIVTSTDGVVWTAGTFGATNYFKAVAHSNGLWVAVGTGGAIVTSPDGSDWTLRSSGTLDDLNDVAYGNGFFLVVGDHRPPNGTVLVSSDGVSWFNRSFSTGKNLRGVTFANGLFLVVGNDGIIYASADGMTWAPRLSGIFGNGRNLRNATYAEGHWIVVGNDGIIITSTNTVDWTRRAPRTPENLHGVRSVRGTFMAIGNRGTILQSGRFLGPELKAREFVPGLGFVFAIEGETGRDYVLQGSDDLQTWTDLLDFNNTQNTTLFLDEEAEFFPMRFYRVVSP